MDSLTWDSSFKAKLRPRAAVEVSLKPVCGGEVGGRAMMRGKGFQVIHAVSEATAKQEGVLGHRGSRISKMSMHTAHWPRIDSILFSHFKEDRFTEE